MLTIGLHKGDEHHPPLRTCVCVCVCVGRGGKGGGCVYAEGGV